MNQYRSFCVSISGGRPTSGHSDSSSSDSYDYSRGKFPLYFFLIVSLELLGLGIGCNFMIDNQLQPTDRLSIMISSLHF